ncbi:helix-turn-helix domain-containing protein [Bradyrhizobium sp. LA2.1]|uniref:helix-turn-helix domain-containing protein n=1 Tax=Bradyrhizobium sp. LA2.1 TaxID=3156376 RepID=UPI0033909906
MVDRIAYSVHEACQAVGIGLTKLREEIKSNRLPAKKVGKRTMILVSDLHKWAENLMCLDTSDDIEDEE